MAKPDSKIKAVFFDIGNVLLRFDPAEVRRRILATLGKKPMGVLRLILSGRLVDDLERGRLPPRELYRVFREDLGFPGDYASFRLLWCDHFTLNRDTQALLKKVARRTPVYLLSNTNHLHYEFIRKHYAFPRLISGAVLSFRLGLRKPGPGIYKAALRRARVQAREALFIDDMRANVRGARAVGMRALRYRGAKRLRQELRGLGLVR